MLKGNGAQGRTRTTDTRIFSPLLYQLSYLGTDHLRLSRRSRMRISEGGVACKGQLRTSALD